MLQKSTQKLLESNFGGIFIRGSFKHFSKFLPVNKVYENEFIIAFHHPKPAYKTHIVIIPKANVSNLMNLTDQYLSELFKAIKILINETEAFKTSYRLITNGGENQKVKVLHFHLVSE